ncbi:MAG: beta-ketoacyl synthase chain length factor [Candidatus Accumulibacter sp.]|nr:beta-ketoacyl synthase chain length factor [Accumulibacter sp.]
MNLRRWTAWAPKRETPEAWRAWAHGGSVNDDSARGESPELTPPPAREIAPLLRRRASLAGRAVLHVLSRPEVPYAGQAIIFCSRFGEFARSLEALRELAQDGRVSPQQFSMAVHHATGGLFMIAQKARAPLTALAALEETALAGLQEAQIQLADAAETVWLVYGDEPLPLAYRSLSASPAEHSDYFAFLLELVPGEDFHLVSGDRADLPDISPAAETPLDLLRFFLCPEKDNIRLSTRGNWILRRRNVVKI